MDFTNKEDMEIELLFPFPHHFLCTYLLPSNSPCSFTKRGVCFLTVKLFTADPACFAPQD